MQRPRAARRKSARVDSPRPHSSARMHKARQGLCPLRRAIQRRIEDSFATAMLEGKISDGDSVKAVLNDKNEIEYLPEVAKAGA